MVRPIIRFCNISRFQFAILERLTRLKLWGKAASILNNTSMALSATSIGALAEGLQVTYEE